MNVLPNLGQKFAVCLSAALFGVEARAALPDSAEVKPKLDSSIDAHVGRYYGMVDITLSGHVYITGELCSVIDCRMNPPNIGVDELDSGADVYVTAIFFSLPAPHNCSEAYLTAFGTDGSTNIIKIEEDSRKEWCKLVFDWSLRTPRLRALVSFLFLDTYRLFKRYNNPDWENIFDNPLVP